MKKKIFDVYCDVYGVNLLVILGMEKDKVRLYLEKKYKVEWDYENNLKAGGVFRFNKWPYQVLWLNCPKIDFLPKLAHEIYHHVQRTCVSRGIPTYPEIDNLIVDEAAAYLMEFYMREILKKL